MCVKENIHIDVLILYILLVSVYLWWNIQGLHEFISFLLRNFLSTVSRLVSADLLFVMRLPGFIFVFLICAYAYLASSGDVLNGDELVESLCDNVSSDMTLHSHSYYITKNKTCVVNNTGSLKISSNSNEIVNVSCVHQNSGSPVPTVAFGFFNMTVNISRVRFIGCGSILKGFSTSFLELMNSSKFFFTKNHSSLFVFVNSNVTMIEVHVTNYYGFAIIGVNLQKSYFKTLNVTHGIAIALSSTIGLSIGSGVLFFSFNSASNFSPTIELDQCLFFANYEYSRNDTEICVASRIQNQPMPMKIFNAAALTVITSDRNTNLIVNITNANFSDNFGTHTAALMVILLNTTASVRIDGNTTFKSNNNFFPCPGSAISFYVENRGQKHVDNSIFLRVYNTQFIRQDGIKGNDLNYKLFRHGAVFLGVRNVSTKLTFEFMNVKFKNNLAENYGSCLFSIVYGFPTTLYTGINVRLINLLVEYNGQTREGYSLSEGGLFVFINNYNVTFGGNSTFRYNTGTVVRSMNSPIYLKGKLSFKDNHGKSGAAFNIINSLLFFHPDLQLKLINNTVEYLGGVFYIVNTVYVSFPVCAMQFLSNKSIVSSVSNNTAIHGGNLIYAFPIYNCYQTHLSEPVTSFKFYEYLLGSDYNSFSNDLLEISSHVDKVLICNNLHSNQVHYPGENISFAVKALDKSNNYVYSLVYVKLGKTERTTKFTRLKSSIQSEDKIQIVQERRSRVCSNISVTIRFFDKTEDFPKLYLFLVTQGDGQYHKLQLNVTLKNCPLGFTLVDGSCQCSRLIQNYYITKNFNGKCDINTLTIQKPITYTGPWLGYWGKNAVFAFSNNCPIGFCSPCSKYSVFKLEKVSGTFVFGNSNLSQSRTLCNGNREGVMCGNCKEGYCVVFGSDECKKCSNWHLWILCFSAVSGILLIYILYLLRLTLTAGTLNGIIFFAQAANAGILQASLLFEKEQVVFYSFLHIFLSLLNLNLGFPLCFFNGMTELWKTGLSLVFPVYLLGIVVFLIVLSRYSSLLSNRIAHSSVQVLVTVVHLSVSKMLTAIIDIFTPATIFKEDEDEGELVWYRNGTIPFTFIEHRLLTLMGLTVLVVSIFFIPYFMFLIGGRCLVKSSFGNKYFRSAYESIHAPFRSNRKYWFSLRFILLISMYLIYATLHTHGVHIICLTTLPLLIVFLIAQVYLRPFKSKLINLMDTAVMLDLVMIYVIGLYNLVFSDSMLGSPSSNIAVFVLIFLIFFLFLCVIIYHISLVTGLFERLKLVFRIKKHESATLSHMNADSDLLLSHDSRWQLYS